MAHSPMRRKEHSGMFIFEHKRQPILPHSQFLKRMLRCALLAAALVSATIALGTIVYHSLENQTWIDASLNSVMIMSGLGLQNELQTFSGKLFTAVFALLSAIVFYSMLAILFTPPLHRFLHHFHLDKDQ